MVNIAPISTSAVIKNNNISKTQSNLQHTKKQNISFGDKYDKLELSAYSIGAGRYPLSGLATFKQNYSDEDVSEFNETHKLPEGYYLIYNRPKKNLAKKTGNIVTIPGHYSLENLDEDRVKELKRLGISVSNNFDPHRLMIENKDNKTYIKDVRINDIDKANARIKKDKTQKRWAATLGILAMGAFFLCTGFCFFGDCGGDFGDVIGDFLAKNVSKSHL